jgi:uncharacterized protein with NRDE domain
VNGTASAAEYAGLVTASGAQYPPFNLLLFDGQELWYASNRAPPVALACGVHAFSNAPHGTEWPKTASARARLESLLGAEDPVEPLFGLLAARSAGGVSTEDRYLSAHFFAGSVYGTRCSTVIALDASGVLTFAERSFDPSGELVGESRATFVVERG